MSEKIHKQKILVQRIYGAKKDHRISVYLCNWAASATKNKMVRDWKKVTCKNCLRKLSSSKVNEV